MQSLNLMIILDDSERRSKSKSPEEEFLGNILPMDPKLKPYMPELMTLPFQTVFTYRGIPCFLTNNKTLFERLNIRLRI